MTRCWCLHGDSAHSLRGCGLCPGSALQARHAFRPIADLPPLVMVRPHPPVMTNALAGPQTYTPRGVR